MLAKEIVADPLTGSVVSRAIVLHFGVELALSIVIVVVMLSLHEIRRFAPLDLSVSHESVIGAPDITRPNVSDEVNEVVIGSGTTLVSTETVSVFACAPL